MLLCIDVHALLVLDRCFPGFANAVCQRFLSLLSFFKGCLELLIPAFELCVQLFTVILISLSQSCKRSTTQYRAYDRGSQRPTFMVRMEEFQLSVLFFHGIFELLVSCGGEGENKTHCRYLLQGLQLLCVYNNTP